MRRAFLFGLLACALGFGALGGFGCSSDDDDSGGGTGGSGGSGGSGGTAPRQNVYVNEVRGPGGCLPRPLTTDEAGQVPCWMIEARTRAASGCACDAAQGRVPVTLTNVVANVEETILNTARCGAQGTPACADLCYCEIQQFLGADLLTCEGAATDPGALYGYCYVDPMIDSNSDGTPDANPALLADCDDTEKRKLRFLGPDVPASDALLFIACLGATAVQ